MSLLESPWEHWGDPGTPSPHSWGFRGLGPRWGLPTAPSPPRSNPSPSPEGMGWGGAAPWLSPAPDFLPPCSANQPVVPLLPLHPRPLPHRGVGGRRGGSEEGDVNSSFIPWEPPGSCSFVHPALSRSHRVGFSPPHTPSPFNPPAEREGDALNRPPAPHHWVPSPVSCAEASRGGTSGTADERGSVRPARCCPPQTAPEPPSRRGKHSEKTPLPQTPPPKMGPKWFLAPAKGPAYPARLGRCWARPDLTNVQTTVQLGAS